MKMKTNGVLMVVGLVAAVAGPVVGGETMAIDPEKSKVSFKIMNKPPGASEFTEVEGTFGEFSGEIVFDEGDPAKSSVKMEVKTASVDTANEKRDDHLRNPDFFKVKEFPLMTFVSKEVKKAGEKKLEVSGEFTLLGETKPLKAVFEITGEHAGKTSFRIKRSDYGMTYRVPDTADEVDVTLEIVGSAK